MTGEPWGWEWGWGCPVLLSPEPWSLPQDPKVIQGQVDPQEAYDPPHPNPNTPLGGEWIVPIPARGFSNVPILCLLLGLIKAYWVCFEDKGKNNITLF